MERMEPGEAVWAVQPDKNEGLWIQVLDTYTDVYPSKTVINSNC